MLRLQRIERLLEPPGVRFLRAGQRLKPLGDLFKPLFASGLGKSRIHLGILVGFALDGRLQVLVGVPDRNAGDGVADLRHEIEVTERVTGLTLRRVAEHPRDVRVALDVRLPDRKSTRLNSSHSSISYAAFCL